MRRVSLAVVVFGLSLLLAYIPYWLVMLVFFLKSRGWFVGLGQSQELSDVMVFIMTIVALICVLAGFRVYIASRPWRVAFRRWLASGAGHRMTAAACLLVVLQSLSILAWFVFLLCYGIQAKEGSNLVSYMPLGFASLMACFSLLFLSPATMRTWFVIE